MEQLTICPSTLAEGFQTYSPTALRLLFDGNQVSHILPFDSPSHEGTDNEEYAKHVGRISLSGVQPKAGLIVKDHQFARPSANERGRYILKPAPSSFALLERKDCPANEHLSMQIASQVYRIDRETVLKVFKPNTSLEIINQENERSRNAFVSGIPTAISYDIVKVGDCYGTVYELLDAKDFLSIVENDKEHLKEHISKFAKACIVGLPFR